MKEYVEKAAVISIIKTAGFWEKEDSEVAITCVNQTPAADVAEVRHGRWYLAEDAVFRCSECERICYEIDAPYCYCGAKMDKEG